MIIDKYLTNQSPLFRKLKSWQWWVLVVVNIFFLIAGQAAAVILGRYYYDQGGNSKWLATLVQTAAFPILYIPLFLLPASQELSFQKVLKRQSFGVVLDMQIYTSFVATCICIVGLFASGEWRTLSGEMQGFGKGKVSYVMVIVWTAVSWQVCSVGVVGLIYVVSSLFSNVISTSSLAITPVVSVIVFHDKVNGVKVIAMLMAIWGFASYIYQNYLDDYRSRKSRYDGETRNDP